MTDLVRKSRQKMSRQPSLFLSLFFGRQLSPGELNNRKGPGTIKCSVAFMKCTQKCTGIGVVPVKVDIARSRSLVMRAESSYR